ncbi:hypothetical protein LTR37_002170 [Vermiconidia calcicola]|uniref:Uncharacterized protein n=1 Tax=Vermiconidia calcicola TaxID=1690605 RepID=A0ACC3NTS8_9PEZI|nr:hypothetical protein LTR37_002170 [Vermiconidia calcicola]
MAAVLPHRPNTNSTSTSGSIASRTHTHHRRTSLSSFPSGSQDGATTYSHHPTISQPSSAQSYASLRDAQLQQLPARNPRRRQKTVKSQYPPDSAEKHVEYILVASFDIDRGSVMEHQYPGPVGGDEHMLAELMLPDGAHVRAQDWTIFFLHKDGAVEEEGEGVEGMGKKKSGRRKSGEGAEEGSDYDEESEDEADQTDGPPLVYVLNLVNMKQDKTVKRGAVVKAMAICTRHSFLHIYKPLLLLALQQYFANPVMETLASLYEAVNSMDLSLMPRLSFHERSILQSSEAKDLFLEKFEAIIAQRMASNNNNPQQNTAAAATSRFGLPRDTHSFETIVHYTSVPVPIKIPVALSPETVGDFSLVKLITTFSHPHPFAPTHPHLTTNGPLTHPIIVLINALLTQKRIIFLGHNLPSSDVAEAVLGACALASGGLLRGFTRHAFPYTDLTKIDDLLKVPGFIAGVTNPNFANKTEWWDLLCDISTGKMRISGRIEQAPLTEGVLFFQQNNGAAAGGGHMNPGGGISGIVAAGASLSAGLGGGGAVPQGNMAGDVTGDNAFMQNVLQAINERHGENAVRAKFRRWVYKFTRLAAAFEECVYGATSLHIQHARTNTSPKAGMDSPLVESPTLSRHNFPPEVTGHGYVWPSPQAKNQELAANATRIEGWRNTRSYYNFIQDLAAYYTTRPVKDLDLHHLHDKLAKLRLTPDTSAQIYLAVCSAVQTDAEISQLLATIVSGSSVDRAGSQPQGLFTLALGLFHPKVEVREATAGLLGRVREHDAGRHFWMGLGRFVRIGFERVVGAKEVREEGS